MTTDQQLRTPLKLGDMSDAMFHRFRDFIYKECGINLGEQKKSMLETRLHKRIQALNMASYKEYAEYVFTPQGLNSELSHMIDVVTTNKTDFFREPDHFTYLTSKALPTLKESREVGNRRRYLLWSAGCSTGEEPYTLSMVLSEYHESNPGFDFLILATDISNIVLDTARKAIYPEQRSLDIPPLLRKKYLLKSKDRMQKVVRIVPELRRRVKFHYLNFMDNDFGITDRFDAIFCRNVIIYFDRTTQEHLLNKFARQLIPGGYLFMGHSETLTGLNVKLDQVSTTVYKKPFEP
ncbi:MAG: protein-glutamate O-methyltransferase [Candidatus Ozemobacteraceae bacterium]